MNWQVSDGWKNEGSEFDCTWQANNVWQEADLLIMHAKSESYGKSCSEIRTYDYVRRGRYEVEMQAGAVPGTISSFFTYAGESGTASHYEVDIELMGGTNLLHTNVWIRGQQFPVDIDLGQYGMSIWNMEKYAFSIDEYGVTWEVFSRYQNKWVQVRRASTNVSSYMQLFINNWISANPQFPPSYYNGSPAYAKYRTVRFIPYE
ncbi:MULTISPECIES: family 16 glycosylhydrolase [Vibrio]|uniref:Family 16 glycosylhydrolase n=2 Tax=Gammaproteobacteria TaxID=1236 RepID=A0A975UAN8_9VIBR|nr:MULTISPECIES: family 16 glycosylhydrolase [Vibrio]QXO18324.1 family 16 glycosylhydrolase [Vibrio ostreae]